MKVRDLLDEIQKRKDEYPDLLDWDVYAEQIAPHDRAYKKLGVDDGGQGWSIVKDGEGWEYFECVGFNTFFIKEKIFTINVNY